MVSVDTSLKNMINTVLRRENIKKPFKDVFTKRGIRWLKSLNIVEIQSCLDLITATDIQVQNATDSIPIDPYKKEIELLKTMPGVGDITAPVIMSEIVDIKRFENPKVLCKYAGLVPKVIHSSPEKCMISGRFYPMAWTFPHVLGDKLAIYYSESARSCAKTSQKSKLQMASATMLHNLLL